MTVFLHQTINRYARLEFFLSSKRYGTPLISTGFKSSDSINRMNSNEQGICNVAKRLLVKTYDRWFNGIENSKMFYKINNCSRILCHTH